MTTHTNTNTSYDNLIGHVVQYRKVGTFRVISRESEYWHMCEPIKVPKKYRDAADEKGGTLRLCVSHTDVVPGELVYVEGVGTTLTAKAPKAPRPNAERRNEATHADGAAAVAHGKCEKCGAKKGARCVSKLGVETNFVHSPRMAAWDAS